MKNKHPNITFAYHFMGEAIIIFMLFLPLMYLQYQFILYWNYFGLTVVICILFSIYSMFTTKFSMYIVTTPVLMVLFYGVGFSMGWSMVLPIILTWRYLNIRGKQEINRETTYMKIMFLLTMIHIILIKEIEVILFGLLLFFILVLGHICSQLFMIDKDKRGSFNYKLWLYMVSIFIIGAGSFMLLFDTGKLLLAKLWKGVSYLIIFVAGQAARMMDLIDYSSIKSKQDQQVEVEGVEDQPDHVLATNEAATSGDYIDVIFWVGAIIVTGIIIYVVFRSFNQTVQPLDHPEMNQKISDRSLDEKPKGRSIKHFFRESQQQPNHPARKMVYKFERKVAGSKYERKSFETIEEWLVRLELDTNIAIYQKVRYGELALNESEVDELKKELKQIELRLEKEN